jgi:hypothetical protein
MDDQELFLLMKLNVERTQNEKDRVMEEFYKMDDFIHERLKLNAKNHVFNDRKEFEKALKIDMNPFSTFEMKE